MENPGAAPIHQARQASPSTISQGGQLFAFGFYIISFVFCWCLCLFRHGKLIWCQQLNHVFCWSISDPRTLSSLWMILTWSTTSFILTGTFSLQKIIKDKKCMQSILVVLSLTIDNDLKNKKESDSKEVWTAEHLFLSPINSSGKSTFMSFEAHVWCQNAQGPCRLQPCAWLLQNREAAYQEGGSISVIIAGKRFTHRNGDGDGSKGILSLMMHWWSTWLVTRCVSLYII